MSAGLLALVPACACLLLYVVVWTVALVGTLTIVARYSSATCHRTARPVPSTSSPPLPGVSILRPLKGLDLQLELCLESAFRQHYPLFEIILSTAHPSDPAIPVATALIAKYPHVPAKLIVGADEIGPNPKINNLLRPYSQAKYDIIWILDANTHVPPDALRCSVHTLLHSPPTPRPIQLIHHLPIGVLARPADPPAWGALLEEIYLSTAHAKFYVSINRFGIAPCVMGKSNLFRKSALSKATSLAGLTPFAHYIAEDHLIAHALWYRSPNPGPNHAMTCHIARQPVQHESLRTYFDRRIRWIRARKYMVTSATLIEPFTECFLSGLLGSYALQKLCRLPFPHTYLCHLLLWLSLDLFQFHVLHSNSSPPCPRPLGETAPVASDDSTTTAETTTTPEFARGIRPWTLKRLRTWLVCWFIREATCLPLWIVAMFGNPVVTWRDRKFKVRPDMTVVEIR